MNHLHKIQFPLKPPTIRIIKSFKYTDVYCNCKTLLEKVTVDIKKPSNNVCVIFQKKL